MGDARAGRKIFDIGVVAERRVGHLSADNLGEDASDLAERDSRAAGQGVGFACVALTGEDGRMGLGEVVAGGGRELTVALEDADPRFMGLEADIEAECFEERRVADDRPVKAGGAKLRFRKQVVRRDLLFIA